MITTPTNQEPGNHLINLLDEVAKFELKTTAGFFRAYFELLPYYPSQETAFKALNEKFNNITGVTRFKDYTAFRNALGRA